MYVLMFIVALAYIKVLNFCNRLVLDVKEIIRLKFTFPVNFAFFVIECTVFYLSASAMINHYFSGTSFVTAYLILLSGFSVMNLGYVWK